MMQTEQLSPSLLGGGDSAQVQPQMSPGALGTPDMANSPQSSMGLAGLLTPSQGLANEADLLAMGQQAFEQVLATAEQLKTQSQNLIQTIAFAQQELTPILEGAQAMEQAIKEAAMAIMPMLARGNSGQMF